MNSLKVIVSFFVFLTAFSNAKAQNPEILALTPKGNFPGVVLQVLKNRPIKDGYEGYVLIKYNGEFDEKEKFKVLFENGRRAKNCIIVEKYPKQKTALAWAWIPNNIQKANWARETKRPQTFVGQHIGLTPTFIFDSNGEIEGVALW